MTDSSGGISTLLVALGIALVLIEQGTSVATRHHLQYQAVWTCTKVHHWWIIYNHTTGTEEVRNLLHGIAIGKGAVTLNHLVAAHIKPAALGQPCAAGCGAILLRLGNHWGH